MVGNRLREGQLKTKPTPLPCGSSSGEGKAKGANPYRKHRPKTALFSLSTKKEVVHLKLGQDPIPQTDTPTFLGVKLDYRLTWKPHIDAVRVTLIRILALMKKLAGTSLGANSAVLKQVYTGYVRPVMEYGSTSWSTSASSNKAVLDRVQN